MLWVDVSPGRELDEKSDGIDLPKIYDITKICRIQDKHLIFVRPLAEVYACARAHARTHKPPGGF